MKNWLGQRIKVGDVVWRGAREGDRSSFKVGEVIESTDKKIRVNWLYYSGWMYFDTYADRVHMPMRMAKSVGTLKSAESLVVIHPDLLVYAKLWNDRLDEYKEHKYPDLKQMIIDEFGEKSG